jgi:hypothetical protein
MTGYERAQQQIDEDTTQLEHGLHAKRRGAKAVREGRRVYDVDAYIAEKNAERLDDGAGVKVGGILNKAYSYKESWGAATKEIFGLLCDH